jgi:hypothetical protein
MVLGRVNYKGDLPAGAFHWTDLEKCAEKISSKRYGE